VGLGRVTGVSVDGARTLDIPLACVGEFRDGRLVRGRAFPDADAALTYVRSRRGAAPSG
jgi:ketosteroid isomerase-like protein